MSRALQALKIREIGAALEATELATIQDKADALGLPRSTTWTLLRAEHKNSGLTAMLVNTMLASPKLPEPVRLRLLEYVDDKICGRYGHNAIQLRRFAARLTLMHWTDERNGTRRAVRIRTSSYTSVAEGRIPNVTPFR